MFSAEEIAQCFAEENIKDVVVAGDSLTRDLVVPFCSLIGSEPVGSDMTQKLYELEKAKAAANNNLGGDFLAIGPGEINICKFREWDERGAEVDPLFHGCGLFEEDGPQLFVYARALASELSAIFFGFTEAR